jgi:hypothetical protein
MGSAECKTPALFLFHSPFRIPHSAFLKMSWRTITEDDLRAAMNSPEDQAARSKYLAANQTDPFCQTRDQVTADFREAIRSAPGNSLSIDEMLLPESAIRHAVIIIRHGLLSRFGMEISAGRMKEWDSAQDYLKKVESGARKVVHADSLSPADKPATTVVAVNQSPRRQGWRNQDGI